MNIDQIYTEITDGILDLFVIQDQVLLADETRTEDTRRIFIEVMDDSLPKTLIFQKNIPVKADKEIVGAATYRVKEMLSSFLSMEGDSYMGMYQNYLKRGGL